MSAFTGHRSRPCTTSSSTFSPISRRSSMREIGQHLAEIEHLRPQRLPAREGQQLPHQARGAVGVLLDLHDVLEGRIGRLVRVEQEVGRHHDGGQHVVEVVRDAAGELADRFPSSAAGRTGSPARAARWSRAHRRSRPRRRARSSSTARDVEARRSARRSPLERGVDRRDLALPVGGLARSRLPAPRGRARRRRRGSSGLRPAPSLSTPGTCARTARWCARSCPALSTVAIAIGVIVEEAHEAHFGGALRIGAVAARAVEHQRARGAGRAVGAERDLVEQPHRHACGRRGS